MFRFLRILMRSNAIKRNSLVVAKVGPRSPRRANESLDFVRTQKKE